MSTNGMIDKKGRYALRERSTREIGKSPCSEVCGHVSMRSYRSTCACEDPDYLPRIWVHIDLNRIVTIINLNGIVDLD